MTRITVLLAEDHLIVREGFRSLLKTELDIEVIGEAETGRQAVALAKKLKPAVVVMDIAMPQLNGLEATRQLHQVLPDIKILILSAHSDDAYVDQALAAGAVGFLLKQTSAHDLSKAIREVHKGNQFFSPSIVKSLRIGQPETLDRSGNRKGKVGLTSRELEVLQLIAEGEPNKQVAGELGLSVKTVEKHRQSLMAKLNIHDVAGLTRYAIGAGIIESSVHVTII